MSLDTPVAFLVFNRPNETKKVFEEIKKAKPKKLYIISDGPRKNNNEDKKNCLEIRKIIENGIDWKCDLKLKNSKENLGCKKNVSSGINWVFENEEKAIFLEDDCLPNQSFFRFTHEMLNKYADNPQVYHIGGINPLSLFYNNNGEKYFGEYDYDFTSIAFIWGWGSWKRAWKDYDVELEKFYNLDIKKILHSHFKYNKSVKNWIDISNRLKTGEFNTWDFQWVLTCMMSNGLCIVPKTNMIQNIGFNDLGTHTINSDSIMAKLKHKTTNFPLNHPKSITKNVSLNEDLQLKVFEGNSWKRRLPRTIINKFLDVL